MKLELELPDNLSELVDNLRNNPPADWVAIPSFAVYVELVKANQPKARK